ncbi:MAG: ClpXP protease specificity-enhancing factor SspB [Ancalomicrobiaceae bacterium]|nr:ClpXP protease specificity-enhancing factor SspB [Ancalomicrobiaceae bacterium]
MTQDLIRYDVLVQEALRGVVKKLVAEIARVGLPGQHHFYIAFDTKHPGVRMSSRLRQRYPEEMTVVLQHQFWDLNVTEQAFEVGLSFSGIPERLVVPFNAVKGFFDPSVQFGLQFEVVVEGADGTASAADALPLTEPAPKPEVAPRAFAPRLASAEPVAQSEPKPTEAAPNDPKLTHPPDDEKARPGPRLVPNDTASEPPAGATVVSLDTFRKKT